MCEGHLQGVERGAFEAPARRGAAVAAALTLLRGYKRWLSPLLPPACRFEPTCSEYASLALARYGFWRGSLKALGRIMRCNPFFRGGVDLP
ncbi:MAG: membrane protein insertion efficiency factor YidD [Acidobacteriota bacterium]